jgi:hypothetical protein
MLGRTCVVAAVLSLAGLTACSGAGDAGPTRGGETTSDDEVVTAPNASPPSDAPSKDTTTPAQTEELEVHALANLGDSISQGFDADDAKPIDLNVVVSAPTTIFHDNPALSWVQGTDARVGSLASHYRGLDPKLVVTPLSRSGAELVGRNSGLPNLEKQARALATNEVKPDLVLVLLGGNDVCNRPRSGTGDATETMYSVEEWRAAAVRGLGALADVLPAGATVRFVSMPRVDLLYDAVGDTKVPAVYDTPLGRVEGESTCKNLWTITAANNRPGICKIVTTESSAARRNAIGQRIDAYNTALAEEVRRFDTDAKANPKHVSFESDWHGSLDEGGVKNESGGTFVYEPKHVSKLDCFHPSITGQHDLAALVRTKAKWKP